MYFDHKSVRPLMKKTMCSAVVHIPSVTSWDNDEWYCGNVNKVKENTLKCTYLLPPHQAYLHPKTRSKRRSQIQWALREHRRGQNWSAGEWGCSYPSLLLRPPSLPKVYAWTPPVKRLWLHPASSEGFIKQIGKAIKVSLKTGSRCWIKFEKGV